MAAVLDHIVVNVRFRMDRAQEIFSSLGFCLTPRGHHTLGSTNHLMMFARDYFEILGVPEGDEDARPDLFSSPFGLNGLVFKTDNADESYERLKACGMAGDPPRGFSRPVDLGDGNAHEAAFRTVTARANAFPAGRLYFCEHLTPELIWRDEWLTHPGRITGLAELVIVTPDAGAAARQLGGLLEMEPQDAGKETAQLGFESGFRLSFLAPDAYLARFGRSARMRQDRETYFGALGLRCKSTAEIEKRAKSLDCVSVAKDAGTLAVSLGELDTLVLFTD